MLVERPQGGVVAVFHRDGVLHLDGLVCYRTASFPTGVVRVADDDEVCTGLFYSYRRGVCHAGSGTGQSYPSRVAKLCRTSGRREEAHSDRLLFGAPNLMVAFTQHANTLPELTAQVLLAKRDKTVKNREARLHRPASILRPTEVRHVQECVRWALKHGIGLTVVGGGHKGHCLWPNVVSIDMGAFE